MKKLERLRSSQTWKNVNNALRSCNTVMTAAGCELIDANEVLEELILAENTLKFQYAVANLVADAEFAECVEIVDVAELSEPGILFKELKSYKGAATFAKETPVILAKFLDNQAVEDAAAEGKWEIVYTNDKNGYALNIFSEGDPKTIVELLKKHSSFGLMYNVNVARQGVIIN